MQFGNRKKYFRGYFSSVLSQFKKYHPSGSLKFYNLGIFQSLKLCSLTYYCPALPFKNFILEDLFSSVLSRFKKYHSSENLKFKNLGIFQSQKFRILMENVLPISLKLHFTPNTLGCYELIGKILPISLKLNFTPNTLGCYWLSMAGTFNLRKKSKTISS